MSGIMGYQALMILIREQDGPAHLYQFMEQQESWIEASRAVLRNLQKTRVCSGVYLFETSDPPCMLVLKQKMKLQ